MKVSRVKLENLLLNNVAEIRFYRRIQKPGVNPYRRMLCTNDYRFLNSKKAKLVFNYRVPTGSLPYNPKDYGLVTVYDLLVQDFRQVPADAVDVLSYMRTTPSDEFWKFYNAVLAKIPQADRLKYGLI